MLNFAEQTGSGAVTVVWSFLMGTGNLKFINIFTNSLHSHLNQSKNEKKQEEADEEVVISLVAR